MSDQPETVSYRRKPQPSCRLCNGKAPCGRDMDCVCTVGRAIPVERVREVIGPHYRETTNIEAKTRLWLAFKELGIDLEDDDGQA